MAIKESLVDAQTIEVPFPASVAVAPGDLLFWDAVGGVARPATARADAGSAAANQFDFARLFLGVAQDQRLASETSTGAASRRVVRPFGVFDCDCDAAAFTFGELVGIARTATPLNAASRVAKVTNPALAIGRVLRPAPAGSTVVRCFLSAYEFGFFAASNLTGALTADNTDADTTLPAGSRGVVRMTPTAARKLILPTPALARGSVLTVVNLAPATHAINVRNAADSATLVSVAATKAATLVSDGAAWNIVPGA